MSNVRAVYYKRFGHSVFEVRNFARHIVDLMPIFIFIINKLITGTYIANLLKMTGMFGGIHGIRKQRNELY